MLRLLHLCNSKSFRLGFFSWALLAWLSALLLFSVIQVTAQKRTSTKNVLAKKPAITRQRGLQKSARNKKVPRNRNTVVAHENSTQCPTTPPTDPAQCGGGPCLVHISQNDPDPRQKLKDNMWRDNVTVLLAPNLDLDFTGLPDNWFPITFGKCSTLKSVSSFDPTVGISALRPQPSSKPRIARPSAGIAGNTGPIEDLEVEQPMRIGSARTPTSPGPILRYGTDHALQPDLAPYQTFLQVSCSDDKMNDGVRISGFRLHGPTFGPQESHEVGIRILNCVDIEISNMEIAGWGEAAIRIQDNDPELLIPEGCVKLPNPSGHPRPLSRAYSCPPGKVVTKQFPGPGGRISRPDQIRIFNNFIHHNQHPTSGDAAAGYGVNVAYGAWAQISENVFDFNRHAIKGGGDSGGYIARRNLVLKGGGIHGRFGHYYTHQFDVHGDRNCGIGTIVSDSIWNCGHAGWEVGYEANAFQYTNNHAIKVRGKPRTLGYFSDNIFPHKGIVDSPLINGTDGGIAVYTGTNMEVRPGNVAKTDSFGQYQVCDFDGDGLDDLFLATGASWWYSSQGKFPWSYMSAKKEKWDQIKVGYFDNDLRCDVLTERGGQWLFSSGGYGDWQIFGPFEAPLTEIEFGKFEPSPSDPPGVRRTPHAFRRAPDSQWYITALYSYKPGQSPVWKDVASSGKPLDELKFGDFTGDGITDVLAVDGGRWAISDAARMTWVQWNQNLNDNVSQLLIANMDTDDNIDDILRLERTRRLHTFDDGQQVEQIEFTWWRSKDGTDSWKPWHTDRYVARGRPTWDPPLNLPLKGFIGRFASSPGFTTLTIDPSRVGRFYRFEAGRRTYWNSEFAY